MSNETEEKEMMYTLLDITDQNKPNFLVRTGLREILRFTKIYRAQGKIVKRLDIIRDPSILRSLYLQTTGVAHPETSDVMVYLDTCTNLSESLDIDTTSIEELNEKVAVIEGTNSKPKKEKIMNSENDAQEAQTGSTTVTDAPTETVAEVSETITENTETASDAPAEKPAKEKKEKKPRAVNTKKNWIPREKIESMTSEAIGSLGLEDDFSSSSVMKALGPQIEASGQETNRHKIFAAMQKMEKNGEIRLVKIGVGAVPSLYRRNQLSATADAPQAEVVSDTDTDTVAMPVAEVPAAEEAETLA